MKMRVPYPKAMMLQGNSAGDRLPFVGRRGDRQIFFVFSLFERAKAFSQANPGKNLFPVPMDWQEIEARISTFPGGESGENLVAIDAKAGDDPDVLAAAVSTVLAVAGDCLEATHRINLETGAIIAA